MVNCDPKLLRVMSRILRYAWASPATMVGLFFAAMAICCGARPRVVEGVIEVAGGTLGAFSRWRLRLFGFEAIALGHVVIGNSHDVLARVRAHEHVHVRQYERWGVFFFPLYCGSSIWQFLRGGNPYRANHFEVEAFRGAEAVARATRAARNDVIGSDDAQ